MQKELIKLNAFHYGKLIILEEGRKIFFSVYCDGYGFVVSMTKRKLRENLK